MSNRYNTIVFVGRFQPVHNAHVEIIRRAQAMADRVIIVVGSANEPRTIKNPFTEVERKSLLQSALHSNAAMMPIIRSAEDHPYNDQAWAVNVVREVAPFLHGTTGIIGHLKDETSFYLKMFPQWEFIDQTEVEPLHAADLRRLYFTSNPNLNFFKGVAPPSTIKFLEEFMHTPQFAQLVREREHIDNYKKQFSGLPYEPVFVTTDACVIQSGHVLMITRRSEPGRGLLALPGGFLNAKIDRSMEDCMIRELNEETGIKVPEKVLRGNIKEAKVFDAIDRSSRGRTITHAFKIVLPEGEWKLPKVKGADDAEHAEWMPIATLDRSKVFEDHYSIIQYFLGQ